MSTPEPQTPGPYPVLSSAPEFAPIIVHIAYSLRNPVDGLEFVLPNDSHPFVSFLPQNLSASDELPACPSRIYDTVIT